MTDDVHLISAEQASYLQMALWTRHPDEPLPPCPVCKEPPMGIVDHRDIYRRDLTVFVGCDHVIAVDESSLADWYATETPWTRRFEEMAHRQQVEARRIQVLRRYLDQLAGAEDCYR